MPANELLAVTIVPSDGLAPIDRRTAQVIARDAAADLQIESDALRRRDLDRATEGADGDRLAALWRQIRAAKGRPIVVPHYVVERTSVTLEPGDGQAPPTVVATLAGTVERATYSGSPPTVQQRGAPARFSRAFELTLADGRYLIVAARGAPEASSAAASDPLRGVRRRSAAGCRRPGRARLQAERIPLRRDATSPRR